MRKRIAAAAAGLAVAAVVGPLGSAAQAADCVGVTTFDATYACIVRYDVPDIIVVDGAKVRVPEVCLVVTCTQERWVTTPDIDIEDDEIAVVYYNGHCYYIGDGTAWVTAATVPDDCP